MKCAIFLVWTLLSVWVVLDYFNPLLASALNLNQGYDREREHDRYRRPEDISLSNLALTVWHAYAYDGIRMYYAETLLENT